MNMRDPDSACPRPRNCKRLDDARNGRRNQLPMWVTRFKKRRTLLPQDETAERAKNEARRARKTAHRGPRPAEQPHVIRFQRRRYALVHPRLLLEAFELARVERLHLQTAADLATGKIGVVVRVVLGPHPSHAFLPHRLDEAGNCQQECPLPLAARVGSDVADHRFHVRQGFLERVLSAGPLHQRVVREPEAASRDARGASPSLFAFDDDHVEAVPVGGDGSGQPRSAGPRDQEIRFEIPALLHLLLLLLAEQGQIY